MESERASDERGMKVLNVRKLRDDNGHEKAEVEPPTESFIVDTLVLPFFYTVQHNFHLSSALVITIVSGAQFGWGCTQEHGAAQPSP